MVARRGRSPTSKQTRAAKASPKRPSAKGGRAPSKPEAAKPDIEASPKSSVLHRAKTKAPTRRARTRLPSPANSAEAGDGLLPGALGGFANAKRQPGARGGRLAKIREEIRQRGSEGSNDRAHPRTRTRPPEAAAEERLNLQGALTDDMAQKMQQLRYLQDFFHNPVPFDLRDKPLPTSSDPEEVATRIGEVEYQIHVLQALIQVLEEELKQLHRAAPLRIRLRERIAAQE